MEMRLAYRIASTPPALPHPSVCELEIDREALLRKLKAEAVLIQNSPKFIFDPVAQFYAAHDRNVWDMGEDIPNWAPPFPCFFAEWNLPRRWNIDGEQVERPDEEQFGVLVMALNVTDETRDGRGNWGKVLGLCMGMAQPMPVDDRLASAIARSRWVLFCSSWTSSNQRPLCGVPLWYGLSYFLTVAATGVLVDQFVSGVTARAVAETGQNELWSPMHVFGLGLSFLHCKNVRRTETPEDRGERWHRRVKVPVLKFYTLDIEPMRQVLRTEGRSEETGIKRAMHICRGHFATYTEDRPLFGKHVGTFWKADHVRGKPEEGIVVKDYRVNPG